MFGFFSSCLWAWMTEFVYSHRAVPTIKSIAPVQKISESLFLFVGILGFDIFGAVWFCYVFICGCSV